MDGWLRRTGLALACALLLAAGPVVAQEAAPRALPGVPVGTGLPIPRFAVLRSDEVNLRTGPGPRHPVDWVIRRRDLPVEITAEFDTWRRIRDIEGTEGWVHQSLLTDGCAHVLTSPAIDLAGDSAVARCHSLVFRHEDGEWAPVRVAANRWELRRGLTGWQVMRRDNALLDGSLAARALLS